MPVPFREVAEQRMPLILTGTVANKLTITNILAILNSSLFCPQMESYELIHHIFPSSETTICDGTQTGKLRHFPKYRSPNNSTPFAQEKKRNFVTFHDNKPLQPLVNEKWEDFNVKINVTLPQVLGWVGSKRFISDIILLLMTG